MAALVLSYTLDPVHEAKASPPSVISPQVATNGASLQQLASSGEVVAALVLSYTLDPTSFVVDDERENSQRDSRRDSQRDSQRRDSRKRKEEVDGEGEKSLATTITSRTTNDTSTRLWCTLAASTQR